jgi:hypothetical protein
MRIKQKTLIVSILLNLLSCNNRKIDDSKTEIKNSVNILKNDSDYFTIDYDTIEIQNDIFIAYFDSNCVFNLVKNNLDTIFKQEDLFPDFEFIDFNNDHFKDIKIRNGGNTPSVYTMLLYNKKKKTFTLLEDLREFPEPNLIKNTNYYYSYHKSGCADMNWDSDLFYIENFKTIKIGNISANECNEKDEEFGITISKVKNDNYTFYKKLPIGIIHKYDDYKWGFIKEYWTKNYNKFLLQ